MASDRMASCDNLDKNGKHAAASRDHGIAAVSTRRPELAKTDDVLASFRRKHDTSEGYPCSIAESLQGLPDDSHHEGLARVCSSSAFSIDHPYIMVLHYIERGPLNNVLSIKPSRYRPLFVKTFCVPQDA
jgi:hypothetical protein